MEEVVVCNSIVYGMCTVSAETRGRSIYVPDYSYKLREHTFAGTRIKVPTHCRGGVAVALNLYTRIVMESAHYSGNLAAVKYHRCDIYKNRSMLDFTATAQRYFQLTYQIYANSIYTI
jgi:hypothetical protein